MFPILIDLFGIKISTYGVLVALGVLVAYFLIVRYSRRENLNINHVENTFIFAVIGGLVGARVSYVVEHPEQVQGILDIVAIWQGGMDFFGGLMGGILGSALGLLIYKLPLWKTADIAVLGLTIAHAIGRLGCTSAGCCYGKPIPIEASPTVGIHFMDRFPFFYVVFPPGAVAPPYIPLYPTQLMEFLGLMIIFFVLLFLYHRKRLFDGFIFSIYMLSYGLLRFFLEFFRGVTPPIEGVGLTWNQLVSIGMMVISLLLLFVLLKGKSHEKVD